MTPIPKYTLNIIIIALLWPNIAIYYIFILPKASQSTNSCPICLPLLIFASQTLY